MSDLTKSGRLTPDEAPNGATGSFAFDAYLFSPDHGVTTQDGRPVKLRPRELSILLVLLEAAGRFVDNATLIRRVWGDDRISEANLRVQAGALRRVLGDGVDGRRLIINATGRGYCLVAPVSRLGAAPTPTLEQDPIKTFAFGSTASAAPRMSPLPARLTPVVGRREVIERLLAHLPHQRLMTVAGPGGIGKTTLALALAEMRKPAHRDGVAFVDLTSVDDPGQVPACIMRALGITGLVDSAATAIGHVFAEKDTLVILDSCEHVVDAVAHVVDHLLRTTPRLQFLATSREPLRIEGEWVHRLAGLEAPPPATRLTAAEALIYPAVQLFVERASASNDGFVLLDVDAHLVAEICDRLDGLPLALELAAARTDVLGLRALDQQLAKTLEILKFDRRGGNPRHATLSAALDWSYQLLPERERDILERLAIFRNGFGLDEVVEVLADDATGENDLIDIVYELVAKSLVDLDGRVEPPRYRLLESTRFFAAQRLAANPNFAAVALRHAHLCLRLIQSAAREWREDDVEAWTITYSRWIHDIRSATEWAYGHGQALLAVELVARSSAMSAHLSSMSDQLKLIEQALDVLRSLDEPNPQLELLLITELGYHTQHMTDTGRIQSSIIDKTIEFAARLPSVADRVWAVRALFGIAFGIADWPRAQTCVEELERLFALDPTVDPILPTTIERMRAQVHHMLGAHADAETVAHRVLARPAEEIPATYQINTRVDPRLTMRMVLARSAWIRGKPVEALARADEVRNLSVGGGGHTFCYSLGFCCVPIAAWSGDLDLARRYASELHAEAERRSLSYWRRWSEGYLWVLDRLAMPWALRGRWGGTLRPEVSILQGDELAVIDPDLLDDTIMLRVQDNGLGWCRPEAMRAQAELEGRRGAEAGLVRKKLQAALTEARTQGSHGWALRALISLAQRPDATAQDRRALAEGLGLIEAGAQTADVQAARDILDRPDGGASAEIGKS